MKLLTHFVLPLIIFPTLTLSAIYLILYQSLVENGIELQMTAICQPGLDPHPFRLPYTNLASADPLLCGLVVFFHTLLDTAHTALLAVIFSGVGVIALVPFLEAARDRHPFALRMPTAIGILFQLFTMGAVMPFYALLFVITSTASLRPSTTSKINQGNAEALLFGLLLGYLLPTTLMVLLVRPYVTATWQAFPLLIAFAALAHKIIRPPSRYTHSGHPTVVVTLAFTCLLSALLHAVYVWPVLTDADALWAIFVPAMDAVDPLATSMADGVIEFIKWDLIFGLGSVMLATLWMGDSLLGLLGILVWYAVASIAVGPAAAIAGVFLWRERRLNGQTLAEDKIAQKME